MRERVFLFACLTSLMFCCDHYASVLEIENKTNQPIIFSFSRTDSIEIKPAYTMDDLKKGLKNLNDKESSCFIAARSKHREFRNSWSAIIDNSFSGTLRVFIFDPDTLQKYPWSDVRDKNRYIHRFKFSTDALRRMNWRIEFSDSVRLVVK